MKLLASRGQDAQKLYKVADQLREINVGKEIHLRGIIEVSSYCKQNCHYCGLRKDNKKLKRYRLSDEEILQASSQAVLLGYKTIVLQSGEDPDISPTRLAYLIRRIKKMDVAVTLSFGEYDYESYRLWRKSGADRYLIKHETADLNLYKKIRPGKSLRKRLQRQLWLKELGYQLGSGCMVGLPGQTLKTLVDDLLLLKEMNVDMAGIGPFIPHPNTPLADGQTGQLELTLNMVALARIIMPRIHLPVTTALGSINPQGRELALQAGANVIMPNVGPAAYKPFYQIYPDKICFLNEFADTRQYLEKKILDLGRSVGQGYGHSLKEKKIKRM